MANAYFPYCINNQACLAKAAQWQSSNQPEFVSFLKKAQLSLQGQTGAWDLSSLLIKPVQRILKYPLLLKELTKFTAKDHPDYESIGLGLKEIENVVDRINKE